MRSTESEKSYFLPLPCFASDVNTTQKQPIAGIFLNIYCTEMLYETFYEDWAIGLFTGIHKTI